MRAHIELLTSLRDTWQFSYQLHGLSYALELTDFAAVEFLYADVIAGGYDLSGSVAMNYGFDMRVSNHPSSRV